MLKKNANFRISQNPLLKRSQFLRFSKKINRPKTLAKTEFLLKKQLLKRSCTVYKAVYCIIFSELTVHYQYEILRSKISEKSTQNEVSVSSGNFNAVSIFG